MSEQEAVMMRFAFRAIANMDRARYEDIARTVARDQDAKHWLDVKLATELMARASFHAQLKRALTLLQLASFIQRDGERWSVTKHGQSNQGTLDTLHRAEGLIRELEADFGAQIDELASEQSEVGEDAPPAAAQARAAAPVRLSAPLWARNTILYGPPGTGKTYATIKHAVALAERGELAADEAPRDRAAFDRLHAAGRIGFVTFHQSYGYEDFVEGLRPETTNGQIRYAVRPGALRTIVTAALDALRAAPRLPLPRPFEQVWQDSDQPLHKQPVTHHGYRVERNEGKLEVEEIAPSAGVAERVVLARAQVEALYELGVPQPAAEAYRNEVRALLTPLGASRPVPPAQAVWAALRPYMDSDEQVIDVSQVPHYVLVIDEINRGNMSRIFGELITLLEPSKRLGLEDALEVELPVSGDTFGVPPNLHILGTMNTADRSIALLDVALRRRFKFVELMPDASRVGYEPARRVMQAINERVELLLDREHQLGHALFMGATDEAGLVEVLRRDVLPLLKEYFYGDWARIAAVLGCAGAKEDDAGALIYRRKVEPGRLADLLSGEEDVFVWRERLSGLDAAGAIKRIVEGG